MKEPKKSKIALWAASVVLLLLGGYFLWRFLAVPTPAQAATIHIQKLIHGDIDWIYEHIPNEEKNMQGMNKEVLKEFYDTFLKEKLEGCEIISIKEFFTFKNKAGVAARIRLKDGTEIEAGTWAIVEDGKILVSAVETLSQFAGEVIFYDKGSTPVERVQYGWKHFSPWFVERGIDKFYSLQSGSFWPLKREK